MTNPHVVATLTIAAMLLASGLPGWQDPTPQARGGSDSPPVVSAAVAPPGTEALAVQWVKVAAPGLGAMLAAVARPSGAGPFPTVVLLHGSHGFAQQYVRLAQALAREGFLAVAPCWFAGGAGAGARFVTPIACPEAPPMPERLSPEALHIVHGLVQAARALPDVRADRVALFGHSRGGGQALNYVLDARRDVQAAVLNSAGYPPELVDRASGIAVPILMLHGTADGPADGGGPMTNVKMAREFEAALRRAGKAVDAMYYEDGQHNGIFASSTQHDDEVRRIVAFLRRHLRH